jgi:hypothetical protein
MVLIEQLFGAHIATEIIGGMEKLIRVRSEAKDKRYTYNPDALPVGSHRTATNLVFPSDSFS